MAAIYPLALQKPIVRNHGGRRSRTRAAILHVDAGGAASLQGWFNNPRSSASSHFYVKYDGTVEQYLDADLIAWTQRAGNTTCVGIETQGLGTGQWTPAQAASIVALLRWLCERYSIPVESMITSAPNSRGIGIHRYGIDPWRSTGAEVWGGRGKICPGEERVAQFPGIISALRGGQVAGVIPVITPAIVAETAAQIVSRLNGGYSVAWIKAIQEKLVRLGYKIDTDGVRGPATRAAIVDFQSKHGLTTDALPGPATNDKLDEALAPAQRPANVIPVQQALRAVPDGIWGPDCQKRGHAVRAASRFHGTRFEPSVAYVQSVVGARADGKWGDLSRKAHDATIANLQRALGVAADGVWGPKSEAAYVAFVAAATK